MAISELKSGHYLEWNVDLAFEGNDCTSPMFRFRDIEHNFQLSRSGGSFKLALNCPNEASRRQFSRFNALVYVRLKKGTNSYQVNSPTTYLLTVGHFLTVDYSSMTTLVAADMRFRYILRFLFVFDCSDKLEIPDKTEDTSFQKPATLLTEHKSVQTPEYSDSNFEIQSLSEDLSKLLDGNSSSDVEIVCRDRTFAAHRCLMAARSDVFKAMLGSDMTEGKTGKIQIEDADAGIFQQFLEYLYKGKLEELTLDTATQLYKLGDKYAVGPLKKQCISFLAENLARDNACSILSLADHHSDQDLKEIATAYVVEQQIPLQDKSDWSSFSIDHPLLAVEVVTRLCKLLASSKSAV